MNLGLTFREQVRKVSHALLLELEQLTAAIRAFLYTEHNADGTHGAVTATSFTGPLTGTVTGNASTATALQTARAINGVNFDGTAAITVTAAAGTLTGTTLNSTVVTSSLTSVGTLGSLAVTGTTGNVTTLTNSYGKHIGRLNGTNALEWHLRANSGRDNFLSFTEDSVADRWVVKSPAGSGTLVFATGNPVTHTDRVVLSGDNVGLGGVTPDTRLDVDAGAIEFAEMTAPSAGAANTARLFCQDNGAGKSQLCVRFNTGAIQVLATEP